MSGFWWPCWSERILIDFLEPIGDTWGEITITNWGCTPDNSHVLSHGKAIWKKKKCGLDCFSGCVFIKDWNMECHMVKKMSRCRSYWTIFTIENFNSKSTINQSSILVHIIMSKLIWNNLFIRRYNNLESDKSY